MSSRTSGGNTGQIDQAALEPAIERWLNAQFDLHHAEKDQHGEHNERLVEKKRLVDSERIGWAVEELRRVGLLSGASLTPPCTPPLSMGRAEALSALPMERALTQLQQRRRQE